MHKAQVKMVNMWKVENHAEWSEAKKIYKSEIEAYFLY